jgi:hypothetical protein
MLLATIQFRVFCLPISSQKNFSIKIYKTVTLPVALCGCETWSLTLKEEHRLRVFENSVLRRISGPKREEVVEVRKRLHNEKLRNLYASSNIIRVITLKRTSSVGHEAHVGKK